jgi:hypothetical protein
MACNAFRDAEVMNCSAFVETRAQTQRSETGETLFHDDANSNFDIGCSDSPTAIRSEPHFAPTLRESSTKGLDIRPM